jgi:outer membrane protein assembly factor BamA
MAFRYRTAFATALPWMLLLQMIVVSLFPVSAQNEPSNKLVTVGSIELSGNKKTKESIVFRELLMATGDRFSPDEFSKRVNQSRLNLLNTSLFNFVTFDTIGNPVSGSQDTINIKINMLERWYLWPVPIVQITDRNFNAWLQTHDFTRINYGIDLKWYNFTGRMDELDAIIQFGKNHQLSIAYQDPYIDRNKHIGIGFEAGYKNNREVGYLTQDDKLLFAFVSEGLSSEKYFSINGTYRHTIFTTHQLIAGFCAFSFSDSLLALHPDYSYTGVPAPQYFYLYYKFKTDHRDIKYYPLKGWYADLELNKTGLGFSFETPVDIAWAKTTTRFYAQLAKRWYSGISFIGKVSSAAWQPYFQIQGLGYGRDYVGGYEYNVIDGKHFGIVRSNVKFALIPEQTHNIGFIPTPKFGLIHYAVFLTAFADAGYVWQPQWIGQYNNVLPRTLLVGAGLGIDLVTYYDKVVRIEYAINKSGKSGIFIHFIAGI